MRGFALAYLSQHETHPDIPFSPVHRLLLAHDCITQTPPPPPALRSPLQKRSHGSQIPFMSQKESLLSPLTPELDGVGQGVDGLLMAADERAAEVDALQVVLFGLQVSDLADVVAVRWC